MREEHAAVALKLGCTTTVYDSQLIVNYVGNYLQTSQHYLVTSLKEKSQYPDFISLVDFNYLYKIMMT